MKEDGLRLIIGIQKMLARELRRMKGGVMGRSSTLFDLRIANVELQAFL